jgi:hypothetical protein
MPIVTIGGRLDNTFAGFADTHMDVANPTTNFSTNGDISIRGSTRENEWITAITRFPGLVNIPGPVVVNEVRLYLYVEYGSAEAQDFALRRLLRDVKMAEATWEDYEEGVAWATAGGRDVLDRVDTISGTLSFTGIASMPVGTEIIVTSAQMAQDVEDWINGVNPSFGWIFERTGTVADRGYFAVKSSVFVY